MLSCVTHLVILHAQHHWSQLLDECLTTTCKLSDTCAIYICAHPHFVATLLWHPVYSVANRTPVVSKHRQHTARDEAPVDKKELLLYRNGRLILVVTSLHVAI